MEDYVRTRKGFLGDWDRWIVAATLVGALMVLVGTGYALGEGLRGLSGEGPDGRPREIVLDALVMAAVSGVLAAAITEFIKRLVRLRERYNRGAVRALLGDLAAFDWSVKSNGVWVTPTPPTYGAPLSQLCAQVGQSLTMLATAVASSDGSRTARHLRSGGSTDVGASALGFFLGGETEVKEFHRSEKVRRRLAQGNASPGMDPFGHARVVSHETASDALRSGRVAVAAMLVQQGERRLDAFQLRVQARWRLMLQWISAGAAAAVMACVGLAVDAGVASLIVGSLLGLVIGGPVSWATRDLVRVVERRAG